MPSDNMGNLPPPDQQNIDNMLQIAKHDLISVPRCLCLDFSKRLQQYTTYQVMEPAMGINVALPDHDLHEHGFGLVVKVRDYEFELDIADSNCHDPEMGFMKDRVWHAGRLGDSPTSNALLYFERWLHSY